MGWITLAEDNPVDAGRPILGPSHTVQRQNAPGRGGGGPVNASTATSLRRSGARHRKVRILKAQMVSAFDGVLPVTARIISG